MKIYLIVSLALAAAATSVLAQSFSTPVTGPRSPQRQRAAPPLSSRDVGGAIPRGIRGGNPLQMLNPRAPARYGTSQDSLSYDQNDPARWRGIKLFEFRF